MVVKVKISNLKAAQEHEKNHLLPLQNLLIPIISRESLFIGAASDLSPLAPALTTHQQHQTIGFTLHPNIRIKPTAPSAQGYR